MQVPFFNLREQIKPLRQQVIDAFTHVIDTQVGVNGPQVGELECDLAGYCDVPYAVAVSSGTDALLVAMMALDIEPGDEVITTPFTFFATAGCIARMGAKPIFVDIEPDTFNIDATKIEAAITDNTRAIMPVHLFGQSADMDAIDTIAEKHGLHVIEDAAQAIGAKYQGKRIGGLGTVGCLSFYPTKNLGGLGEGGMVLTTNEALAKRMLQLRNHGMSEQYLHENVGGNFRLDVLQAAYLSIKLPQLDGYVASRTSHAQQYDAALADVPQVTPPTIRPWAESVYNQYVIRALDRDGLRTHLQSVGVGTGVYYPLSLHMQPCFAHLGYGPDDFAESRKACEQVVALPIYPELTKEQVAYVAEQIAAYYAK